MCLFLYGHKFSVLLHVPLGLGLLGHTVTPCFTSEECPDWFPKGHTVLHSHQHCKRAPVFPIFANTCYYVFFFMKESGCEVTCHCGSNLHFLMALSVLISLHTCHNVGELLFYNNGRERRHLLGRKVGKLQAVVMIHESGRKQGMRWSRCARALKVAATEWGTAPHLGWRAFEDVVWDLELELTLCPKQGHVVQSFR